MMSMTKKRSKKKKKDAEEEITVGAREKAIEWMTFSQRFMKVIRCTRLNDVSSLSHYAIQINSSFVSKKKKKKKKEKVIF